MAGVFLLPEEGIIGSEGVNRCPGYGRGVLGSEEEHNLSDLFRANESWKHASTGYVFHHLSFGWTGTDGIDIMTPPPSALRTTDPGVDYIP